MKTLIEIQTNEGWASLFLGVAAAMLAPAGAKASVRKRYQRQTMWRKKHEGKVAPNHGRHRAPLRLALTLAGLTFQPLSAAPLLLQSLHEFDAGPSGPNGVIQASDGSFYGWTGDELHYSTVFRVEPNGTTSTLVKFTGMSGKSPGYLPNSLVQASTGDLYGTTGFGGPTDQGTVFRLSPTGTFATLVLFNGTNGAYPVSFIRGFDGSFYGTTSEGGRHGLGTVFRIAPDGRLTTLASFDGTNGRSPTALMQSTDGNFYGLAAKYISSPPKWQGILFKMTPEGVLSSILTTNGLFGTVLLQGNDGSFYSGGPDGSGTFTVFRVRPDGSWTSLYRGSNSWSLKSLILANDGNLYGATMYGWPGDLGAIFKLTPDGTASEVASFNDPNGAFPNHLVLGIDGAIYGTGWGERSPGVLFRTTTAGHFATVSDFAPLPLAWPSILVQGSNSDFYGVCYRSLLLFRLTSNGAVSVLTSLDATNEPISDLIKGRDGALYGTTTFGGQYSQGTVFRVTTHGTVSILASFDGTNGAYPVKLVQSDTGDLFLMTDGGSYGTVSKLTPDGDLSMVVSFDGTNGGYPTQLILGQDGNLYGATSRSEATNFNQLHLTVFRLTQAAELTTLATANSTDGSQISGLIEANDGNFYGTTSGGGNGFGTVFKLLPDGTWTTLHSFTGLAGDGANPYGLLQAADGSFYGITGAGGPGNFGTVFQIRSSGLFTTLLNLEFHHWRLNGLIQASDGMLYGTCQISTLPGGAVVRLVEPPVLRASFHGPGEVVLTWNSFTNAVYQVESKPNANGTNWIALGTEVSATGTTTSLTNKLASATESYSRVRLLP